MNEFYLINYNLENAGGALGGTCAQMARLYCGHPVSPRALPHDRAAGEQERVQSRPRVLELPALQGLRLGASGFQRPRDAKSSYATRPLNPAGAPSCPLNNSLVTAVTDVTVARIVRRGQIPAQPDTLLAGLSTKQSVKPL